MSNLTWNSNIVDVLKIAKVNPVQKAEASLVYEGAFPLVNDPLNGREDLALVNAKIFNVDQGGAQFASIVLCRLNEKLQPSWAVYCGDMQAGSNNYPDDGNNLANLLEGGNTPEDVLFQLRASDWVNTVPDMARCAFFRMHERRGAYCAHTQHAVAEVSKEDLEAMASELEGWITGKVVAMPASTMTSEEEEAFYDAAFIQHVMLAGERGSGKTFLARKAAERFDAVYLEMQMHASMEAWEFRAHDRAWDGKVYTVLGKLAEAVYHIQQGKRVVLVMDEFLNLNPVYATAINSALSLTANNTYIIETGKIVDQGDGIGTVETVEVPADMLWVVATTNVGARYGVDQIVPSVRARFQIILMNSDPKRSKFIFDELLKQYSLPSAISLPFSKFLERVNHAVSENLLDEEATTRLGANVLRAISMRAKRDGYKVDSANWKDLIKTQLLREATQIVSFEYGPLNEDQLETYKTIVESTFK